MKQTENIHLYTLENNTHKIVISNFGAAIINFIIKEEDGTDTDIALGHNKLEDYFENPGNLGVVVGRHANRIKDAHVIIDNVDYNLEVNHFHNNLHTGSHGLQFQFFDAKQVDNQLILSKTLKHLEDGFPGTLEVIVTYTLHEDTLDIHYDAVSDQNTVVNLTNHCYFNLNGHDESSIYNHNLYVNARNFMPNDEFSLVQEEILSVSNTPFDFTEKRNIKESLLSEHDQIKPFNGIDHNFLLNIHESPKVVSIDNGQLELNITTDLPAMHIYTGNHFAAESIIGKYETIYPLHGGIAFETQFSPNSLQMPWLLSPLLKKGEHFTSITSLQLKKLND